MTVAIKNPRLNNWLSESEVRAILMAAESDWSDQIELRDAVVLRLGFSAGLRRQEIVDVDWPDIRDDRLRLVGKGGKAAVVRLVPGTIKAIERLNNYGAPAHGPMLTSFRYSGNRVMNTGQRLSTNGVRDITLKYARQTGIRFAPHDMRRTFAGLMLEKTDSIALVSAALRHSDIGVTQRYLKRQQDAAYYATQKAGIDW